MEYQIIEIVDKKYNLKRKIDGKWITKFGKKKILEYYNSDKIIRDKDNNFYVADIIDDVIIITEKELLLNGKK